MKNQQNEDKKKKRQDEAKLKRLKLSEASSDMKDLRKRKIAEATEQGFEMTALRWAAKTVNDLLLEFHYKIPKDTELNTFRQWKDKGRFVAKGEKGTMIWGRPLGEQRKEEANAKGKEVEISEEEMRFFPVVYLFKESQLKPIEELVTTD